jgi:hypothetical protein
MQQLKDPKNVSRAMTAAKIALIGTASLLVFASGVYVNVAMASASSIRAGGWIAGAFTLVYVIVGFPLLVVIGFLVRFIGEWVLRRRLPFRAAFPWLIPMLLGVAGFATAFSDRSPQTVYRVFLDEDAPGSLSSFQYWWTTVPGDQPFVFSFKLDPSEFNKIISRHGFIEDSDPDHIRDALHANFPSGMPGFHLSLPEMPLTKMYTFSDPPTTASQRFLYVLTTERRDTVVVCGDIHQSAFAAPQTRPEN